MCWALIISIVAENGFINFYICITGWTMSQGLVYLCHIISPKKQKILHLLVTLLMIQNKITCF
ncbi:hypothetical protein A8A01_21430 [Ewingella americana]|nr:hypothetical protein A8A01_21430 [Ewingella americana]